MMTTANPISSSRAVDKSRRMPASKPLRGNWPRKLAKRALTGIAILENTLIFDEPTRLRLQRRYLDFWILMKKCERELQVGNTNAQS